MFAPPLYDLLDLVHYAGQWGKVHAMTWGGKQQGSNGVTHWVYQLSDGHWDCYHEDDLETAWWRGV